MEKRRWIRKIIFLVNLVDDPDASMSSIGADCGRPFSEEKSS